MKGALFFPITWLKVMFQVRFLYQVLHQVCSFILFSQNKMTFHKVHHSRASTAYALIYEIGSSKNHCIFSIVHLQIVNFSFYFFGKCIMYTDKKKIVTAQKVNSESPFPHLLPLSHVTLVHLPRDHHCLQ